MNPVNRVASQMLDRRWTLLGAELVLLVIGILIALAIDDWVADTEDRKAERIYLELLVRDLNLMSAELNEQINYEGKISKLAARVYDRIHDGNPNEQSEDIGTMLSTLAVRRTVRLDSATYEDLISTGNLGLIQNRDLRDQIVQYFSNIERLELVMEKNNRFFVDEGFKPFLRDFGVSYRGWADDPTEFNQTEPIASRFSENMLAPVDDVLLLPGDAQEWGILKRQITWRAFGSVAVEGQAKEAYYASIRLRDDIERHLAE